MLPTFQPSICYCLIILLGSLSRHFKQNMLKTLHMDSSPLLYFSKTVSFTVLLISVNVITMSLVFHTKTKYVICYFSCFLYCLHTIHIEVLSAISLQCKYKFYSYCHYIYSRSLAKDFNCSLSIHSFPPRIYFILFFYNGSQFDVVVFFK